MLKSQTVQPLHAEGKFEGERGFSLYYQSWLGPQVEAVVVLVHGLGSHGGLFGPLVERLVAEGCGVYAFDLRGHGRSPGQRAYVDRWSDYREDLRRFLKLIATKYPQTLPCFLFGHSLGGAIALDYVLQFPDSSLAGLMLSAPALSVQGISPLKIRLGQLLSWVWPRFSLDTGIRDRQPPSRDEMVNQVYRQDPLRHTQGTARLSTEFRRINIETWQRLDQLQLPLLLLQGEADAVAPVAIARQFFEQLPAVDKTLRIYPNGYHEIFNDINRKEVMDDIADWLEHQQKRQSKLSQQYG